jgi:hypothetical protein
MTAVSVTGGGVNVELVLVANSLHPPPAQVSIDQSLNLSAMPLSGRSDTASSSKYKEREWKRSYGVIACAECRRSVLRSLPSLIVTELRRRLKLKCDKNVPCSSCTRRGCPSICPNGANPFSRVCPTLVGNQYIFPTSSIIYPSTVDV